MTCKFQSVLFLTNSQSALSIVSSSPSYLLPESLWNVWSLAFSLSSNTILSFQWVPGHAGLPGNEKADLLAKAGASLPTDAIPCPLPPVVAKVCYSQYHNWRRHISHFHLNFQVPEVSSEELLLSRPIRCELSRLRCHGHKNPFVNLSLAPLSLFLTYGPDLGVWPDCWVVAEFLCTPIPRKGSGSTTTTLIA